MQRPSSSSTRVEVDLNKKSIGTGTSDPCPDACRRDVYLNHVLFGSKSAESDEQSRVYGSIKDRHRQWHDRRSSSHQQMPPAFVHRLLSNVLPTLMQQDYEAIEYVCGALLRANEMAIVQGDSKCQEEAPQLLHLPVPFLGESVLCFSGFAETADCERNVELLSLLRTLKLSCQSPLRKDAKYLLGLRLRGPLSWYHQATTNGALPSCVSLTLRACIRCSSFSATRIAGWGVLCATRAFVF